MWKLKEVVVGSGNRLVLPGYGHKGTLLPVFNYVVCWRPQLEASMSDAGVNKSPKYKSMEVWNPCSLLSSPPNTPPPPPRHAPHWDRIAPAGRDESCISHASDKLCAKGHSGTSFPAQKHTSLPAAAILAPVISPPSHNGHHTGDRRVSVDRTEG